MPTVVLAACALGASLVVEPGGLTLDEALDRIRAARASGDYSTECVVVRGTNRLTRTATLLPADSGLRFVGEDGAAFTGGFELEGWSDTGLGWWSCPAPKDERGDDIWFEQLWVNGRRAARSRFPNDGYIRLPKAECRAVTNGCGKVTYVESACFSDDRVKALGAMPEEEMPFSQMCAIVKWTFVRRTIKAYDPSENTVTTHGYNVWHRWQAWISSFAKEALVWFENVRAGFDEPGEWFYDGRLSRILYRPLPGEAIGTVSAVAPLVRDSKLVELRGDWRSGDFVTNVSFRNISFLHSRAPRIPGDTLNGPTQTIQHQAASGSDGAISLSGVRGVVFDGCNVAHTGNYAFRFGSGCMSNAVVNCRMSDLGAGGVWMGADYRYEDRIKEIPRRIIHPESSESTAYNLVSNNVVTCAGRFNPEGVGIILTHCSDTRVVHNDISDIFYTGITAGWTWGFFGSVSQRNEIGSNRIWDLGKDTMSDMGGIYLLGTSFGTRVHDNLVRDVRSQFYGGCGIYLDEGAEGIVVERNLVYNTTNAGFNQHFGSGCVVRNNIFAFSRMKGAVSAHRRVVQGIPCAVHFLRNIVVVSEAPLAAKGVRGMHEAGCVWADNLWYDYRGEKSAEFDGVGWDEWRQGPLECGGVFADPRFVDAANGDFRLRDDSPALALGFKPFDLGAAGSSLK